MSSFLCFVCHSTVNEDTNEDTREKYREVIGMNLCLDSHLCHICCHFLNKMCLFKSICLKRSLEYPVLFSERGTINLQRSDTQVSILCPEDLCLQHLNSRYYFYNNNENSQSDDGSYCQLQDDTNYDIQKSDDLHNDDFIFTKDNDGVFNDDIIPALEPVRMTENDIVEQAFQDSENLEKMVLLELSSKIDVGVEMVPATAFEDKMNSNANDDHSKVDGVDDEAEITNTTETSSGVDTQINITRNKVKGKKGFVKSILTVKEQKNELEAARREEKYITASYKCYNCALSFHFKDSYQAHMMRHEESNGEHSCPVCSLRFANPAVLRAHAANHGERYTCVRCDITVRGSQTSAHRDKCDGADRSDVTCSLCSRSFRGRSHLQQHMKRFHQSKNSNRSYLCNVCGNRYNNQAAVHTHMITHINRKFSCDQCESTFSSPYTLNQHKKRHAVQEARVHYCHPCGIGYSSRKSLLAHMRNALAHNQSIHKCSWCGRGCASAASLRAHAAAVHDRARALHCTHCANRYYTRKALVRHLRTHTEVMKTTPLCHACGETFKSTSILKRHLKNVCEKEKHEQLTYYE